MQCRRRSRPRIELLMEHREPAVPLLLSIYPWPPSSARESARHGAPRLSDGALVLACRRLLAACISPAPHQDQTSTRASQPAPAPVSTTAIRIHAPSSTQPTTSASSPCSCSNRPSGDVCRKCSRALIGALRSQFSRACEQRPMAWPMAHAPSLPAAGTVALTAFADPTPQQKPAVERVQRCTEGLAEPLRRCTTDTLERCASVPAVARPCEHQTRYDSARAAISSALPQTWVQTGITPRRPRGSSSSASPRNLASSTVFLEDCPPVLPAAADDVI